MGPQARPPSPRSSNPSVLTSKPKNSTKSSPNSTAKTSTKLSLKAWASSLPFHLVALPQLPEPLPPPVKLPQLLRKRKNLPKKSPTLTWDLIFLDKNCRKKKDEFSDF